MGRSRFLLLLLFHVRSTAAIISRVGWGVGQQEINAAAIFNCDDLLVNLM